MAEDNGVLFVIEARHFLSVIKKRPWFVWSYAAHHDKKIIAEHARFAKKHFPAFDFRVAKFVRARDKRGAGEGE